jgi:4-hydroxybenzoate polyprenyltransferase
MARLSLVVPAVCRLLFYLMGASAGLIGITGAPIWGGLMLAIYFLGVGLLPRQENTVGSARYWPIVLLAAPILLALIVDDGDMRQPGLLLSAVSSLWTARCLRPALWSEERDFARAVSGLVAGIALVDLLAVASAPKPISAIFIALFLMTRALQTVAARRWAGRT